MTKYLIDETSLTNIGDAIRTKKGTTSVIPVADMPDEILSISGGGESPKIESFTTLFEQSFADGATVVNLSESYENYDGLKITFQRNTSLTFPDEYGFAWFSKELLNIVYRGETYLSRLRLYRNTGSWHGSYVITDKQTLTAYRTDLIILKVEGYTLNRKVSNFDLLVTYNPFTQNNYLPTNWNEYDSIICCNSVNGDTYSFNMNNKYGVPSLDVDGIFVQEASGSYISFRNYYVFNNRQVFIDTNGQTAYIFGIKYE